jgi:hypothetical protein
MKHGQPFRIGGSILETGRNDPSFVEPIEVVTDAA